MRYKMFLARLILLVVFVGKELDLFHEIWDERPHKCSISTCGELLPIFNVRYMSHCVSKGSYPELRLVKENIDILCFSCHQLWENSKWYLENSGQFPEWEWLFDKYVKLKQVQ